VSSIESSVSRDDQKVSEFAALDPVRNLLDVGACPFLLSLRGLR
jgi:hypothetical protein